MFNIHTCPLVGRSPVLWVYAIGTWSRRVDVLRKLQRLGTTLKLDPTHVITVIPA